MTTRISRISKGFTALLVIAVIGIASCNDNATTETPKSDSPSMSTMDTGSAMMAPPAMDSMGKGVDTGRDTKVPRN